MTEPIAKQPISQATVMRRYRFARALWFALGLLTGLALAYAEHRLWLPPMLVPSYICDNVTPSVLGPCIAQTATLPLLFGLGLFRSAYYHTSRFWCFCFWLLHGADLLPCVLRAPLSLLPLGAVLALMMLLLSRADTIAAAGICSNVLPGGMTWPRYLYSMLCLWGALLITQFVFYLIPICFL